MAILSLKVATKIWSPEHSSARMHRLLCPTVFVRRSLDPAVLISLPTVCGRNALARVSPLVGWLVALPQVELNTARRRDSNSLEQCTQCVTRKLQKTDDILTCTVCRMPVS